MHIIGTNVQRKGAADKVRGITKYNIDLIERGILHGKLVTSKYAHARIISINIDNAL